jgi:hypothetical protein
MIPGKQFEEKCYNFLSDKYANPNIRFDLMGGADSTVSDIAVFRKGSLQFYIEAKDCNAQAGQFVLLPDDRTQTFVFSERNQSSTNELTDLIIGAMNSDYYRYKNAGTSGVPIILSNNVLSRWVMQYYSSKDVKYFITYAHGFIIFPIERFADYFAVSATYRVKRSGSSSPAKRDISPVMSYLEKAFSQNINSEIDNSGHLFVTVNSVASNRFTIDGREFYLSATSAQNRYEVRKLSNTANANVIFSIALQQGQNTTDLQKFETDIRH